MTCTASGRLARFVLVFATVTTAVLSCADPSGPDTVAPSFAKGGNGGGKPSTSTTVTAADPSFGYKGEQNKKVSITGSGFEPGATAEWQRGGVADPLIQVLSTEYLSSTQLNATISIAVDADLGFYDVAVNYPGRKGGVGTELFEITTAQFIPDAVVGWDVNDNGQMTGATTAGEPYRFSQSGGMEIIGPAAYTGMAISQDGLTIAGSHNQNHDGDTAMVWVKGASGWTQSILPRDPAALGSGADAIGSDPLTGAAQYVSGWELVSNGQRGKNGSTYLAPRLWVNTAGSWQRIGLPTGAESPPRGRAWDVASSGTVAGAVNLKPAVWDPDDSGGYTLTMLSMGGSEYVEGSVRGIDDQGLLVVGFIRVKSGSAWGVYWQRTSIGSPWTGPTFYPDGCGGGSTVDNFFRTTAVCSVSPSASTAGVLVPPLPYTSATMVLLGGLGKQTPGSPKKISPSGAWVVGNASVPGGNVGLYWQTGF